MLSRALRYSAVAACMGIVGCGTSLPSPYRTFDGSGNNAAHRGWGAALATLLRLAPSDYGDGYSSPAGAARPSARLISNTVAVQSGSQLNARGLSDWIWQWGQLVDHDLSLSERGYKYEAFHIPIPTGDPTFDPLSTGTMQMIFLRAAFDPSTGVVGIPREQTNLSTAYLDASMIYGSDEKKGRALRTKNGTGPKLLTSTDTVSDGENLLPRNTHVNMGSGGHPQASLFGAAGDKRANEQPGLFAAHVILMREHNRLADGILAKNPGLSDEFVFQRARTLVAALVQSITFNEFLPALLGPEAPSPDPSYDVSLQAGIFTEFSTAAFRVGHTMLSPQLLRLKNDGTPAPAGPLPLENAFFDPTLVRTSADVDYFIKGLATQKMQEVDARVVNGVRNLLFGEPTAEGLDLVSLNIQRGRDLGLPSYVQMRQALGLSVPTTFAEVSSDTTVQADLATAYASVDAIDLWVGGISEDHVAGASVGPVFAAILRRQFERIRDADRFWFKNDPLLTAEDKAWVDAQRLSDLLQRNSSVTTLQSNAFLAP